MRMNAARTLLALAFGLAALAAGAADPRPDGDWVAGDGSVVSGIDELIRRFESFFADPTFIAFERKTETVILDKKAARASLTS